jgi:hypothetical protein
MIMSVDNLKCGAGWSGRIFALLLTKSEIVGGASSRPRREATPGLKATEALQQIGIQMEG